MSMDFSGVGVVYRHRLRWSNSPPTPPSVTLTQTAVSPTGEDNIGRRGPLCPPPAWPPKPKRPPRPWPARCCSQEGGEGRGEREGGRRPPPPGERPLERPTPRERPGPVVSSLFPSWRSGVVGMGSCPYVQNPPHPHSKIGILNQKIILNMIEGGRGDW